MCALLVYTVHPNWKWVVQESLASFTVNSSSIEVHCKESPRDLPSQGQIGVDKEEQFNEGMRETGKSKRHLRRQKYAYALFRYEFVCTEAATATVMKSDAWATSLAFANLDAKDDLYRALTRANAAHLMPTTYLLPYDLTSIEDMPEKLPSSPCSILKAALGSGGDCLFFVTSKSVILSIIVEHKKKAETFPGFLESLVKDYGAVPAWSLQAYYYPLCIDWLGKRRRSQFRVYAVYSQQPKRAIYIYKQVEVRLPEWNVDLDNLLSNATNCLSGDDGCKSDLGTSRPYNEERNKALTDRVTMMEISRHLESELMLQDGGCAQLQNKIVSHVANAMHALREHIAINTSSHAPSYRASPSSFPALGMLPRNEVAVVGVDIILSSVGVPYILEFNNNPAMPQQHKQMSDAYREHLITLVTCMRELVCNHSKEDSFFAVNID